MKSYSKKEIKEKLLKLGVSRGDCLFLSSSLGMLGRPKGFKAKDLNKIFLKTILDIIGNRGTLFVPTYSYSFSSKNKKGVFDIKKTKPKIGSFPNFFIKQNSIYRNADPFVSVSGKGFLAKKILSKSNFSSYGKNSVFHKLVNVKKAKLLNIGLGPNWTPFIHHAEYVSKISHRFEKVFEGYTRNNNKLKKIKWVYFSRVLINQTKANVYKVGSRALRKQIWNSQELGRSNLYLSNYKRYFKFVLSELKKNKWALTNGPKVDLIKEERKKLFKKNKINKNNALSLIDGFNPETEYILKILNKGFKISIKKFKTGYNFLNYVMPERTTILNGKKVRTFDEIKFGIKVSNYSNFVFLFYLNKLNKKKFLFLQKFAGQIIKDKSIRPEILFIYDYNAYVSYLSENFNNNKGKTFVHLNFSNINSYNFKNIKFKLKNKIIKNMKSLKINFKKNLNNFETEGNYYLSKNKLSDYKINEVFYELNTSKFLIKNYDKFLLN